MGPLMEVARENGLGKLGVVPVPLSILTLFKILQ